MTESTKQIESSADLPLAAPADEFKKVFDELKAFKKINPEDYSYPDFSSAETAMETKNLGLRYGDGPYVLYDLTLKIPKNKVVAIIGPSGCGKSTFLRQLNRMNEEITRVQVEGQVLFDGKDILDEKQNLLTLRSKVGMVFQKPQPFPRSIYENVAFGPKLHGINNPNQLDAIVEKTLTDVGLFNEVSERLDDHAYGLSGGQQQRLCVARALAVNPSIILADEPASALDPRSTYQIEDLLLKLKQDYTVIIVTHNMQQAARISDYTLFFYNGNVIEYGETRQIFEDPFFDLTENYISGKFG
jgi:phosphate transport system ATP-binding protein